MIRQAARYSLISRRTVQASKSMASLTNRHMQKAARNMSSGPPGSKLIAYEHPRPCVYRKPYPGLSNDRIG